MELTRPRPATGASGVNGTVNGTARGAPRRPPRPLRRNVVLAGRVLLWTALALLALRGAVTTVVELTSPPAAGVVAVDAVDAAFPVDAARALATRFAQDYLTYDAGSRDQEERLAAYGPGGQQGALGWDGIGEQEVHAAVAVDVAVHDRTRAAVVVAAQVTGRRWVHLSVPLVADEAGGLAVSGSPTLVAAPRLAAVPPDEEPPGDAALSRRLVGVLESFFDAYAAGRQEDLAYYLAEDRTMDGLDGTVELDELVELWVGEGATARQAAATVRWRDTTTGAALTQRYELRLVHDSGRWYVDGFGAGDAPVNDGTAPTRRTR